jgi:hypothetical protein
MAYFVILFVLYFHVGLQLEPEAPGNAFGRFACTVFGAAFWAGLFALFAAL